MLLHKCLQVPHWKILANPGISYPIGNDTIILSEKYKVVKTVLQSAPVAWSAWLCSHGCDLLCQFYCYGQSPVM